MTARRQDKRMLYDRGDKVIWVPGPKHSKTYGKGPYRAVYYSGHWSIRDYSVIYSESHEKYIKVTNKRIIRWT